MLKVILDKTATIMQELSGGRSAIWTVKHGDLAAQIERYFEIEFDYCFGQEKRRIKQLTELGFKLDRTIWRNTDANHARIKQVWVRKEDGLAEITSEDIAEYEGRY
jgi:prolyl-tRNA synthetase